MTALSPTHLAGYLQLLGNPDVQLDCGGLATLQRRQRERVPFHTLFPLLADDKHRTRTSIDELVELTIAGVGGDGPRTTVPFAALLRSLGFDARLTLLRAGRRRQVACAVVAAGRRLLCDVGSGHPVASPWDLDGDIQEQTWNGVRFVFDPHANAGPTLLRDPGEGHLQVVYVVDPTTRRRSGSTFPTSSAVLDMCTGHVPKLQATAVVDDVTLMLLDDQYTRHSRFASASRRVCGRDAVAHLLVDRFGLAPHLVHDALDRLAELRPALFAIPGWLAPSPGGVQDTNPALPRRADVPDILVTLATVGRRASLQPLLDSLAAECVGSNYPGRVGCLIVDNAAPGDIEPVQVPPSLTVQRLPIQRAMPTLRRTHRLGLLPSPDVSPPLPIGVAREAQLALLRDHLREPLGNLPHPSVHPTVAWMVDDDLTFDQRAGDGSIGHHTHLLHRVARFWATLPQCSVALGDFTGDPPVPGLDTWLSQLRDLLSNARVLVEIGPDGRWTPPPTPETPSDAYYDLSEPATAEDLRWPFAPERSGSRGEDVVIALMDALPQLLEGRQITRPLGWDGREKFPRPSLRRGGNTLFLDLDALFRWPTPVLACGDGITTRRGDTIWAALARADWPGAVLEVTLPLRHCRTGQQVGGVSSGGLDPGRDTSSQVRGIALARAIAGGRDAATELVAREARVQSHRTQVGAAAEALGACLERLREWRSPAVDAALQRATVILQRIARIAEEGVPKTGSGSELRGFVQHIHRVLPAWRGAW